MMRVLFKVLATVGLLLVICPPILAYGEATTPPYVKRLMLAGTVVWFVASFFGFRESGQAEGNRAGDEHTPVA